VISYFWPGPVAGAAAAGLLVSAGFVAAAAAGAEVAAGAVVAPAAGAAVGAVAGAVVGLAGSAGLAGAGVAVGGGAEPQATATTVAPSAPLSATSRRRLRSAFECIGSSLPIYVYAWLAVPHGARNLDRRGFGARRLSAAQPRFLVAPLPGMAPWVDGPAVRTIPLPLVGSGVLADVVPDDVVAKPGRPRHSDAAAGGVEHV